MTLAGRVEALPTYGSCGLMQQFSNTKGNTLLRYGATSETVLNEGTSIPGSRLRQIYFFLFLSISIL
jgi:hypothetical protein